MIDNMKAFLNRYFSIDELQTNLRTEILAGVSTYLSLAYIFIVNPAILSNARMDVSAVLFATIVASGVSTLVMGLWARLPFALAPGLEMNGFFAFVVCGVLGLTWQQALGAVFWSGVLCIIMTFRPVRQQIIDSVPSGLKTCIAFSVGVFVATIGFHLSKIVVFKDGLPDSVGSFVSTEAVALYIGLVISFVLGLPFLRFPGNMLVGVIVAAVFCKLHGITVTNPAELSADMFSAVAQMDWWNSLTDLRLLSVLLVFFLVDFYGSIGKFIGLTAATNLQSQGKVRNIGRALYVDGGGTVLGAYLGTSSIITYVESAVGIAAGGRTGIVACVCGLLMLGSLIFTPLVGLVPVEATSGILIYVGYILLPIRQMTESPETDIWEAGPIRRQAIFGRFDLAIAILMGLISFFTFSLDKAMVVGFASYAIRQWVIPSEKKNPWLLGSTTLLAVAVAMQFIWR